MPSFVLILVMWLTTAASPTVTVIPGFATMEECQKAGRSTLWFQHNYWNLDVRFTCVEQTINPKAEKEK